MAHYVLALDQGTTSSRAILFDEDGAIAAVAQEEFAQRYPQPGWVEHDPEDIWYSQFHTASQVVDRLKPGDQIRAIGITNQRETTIIWDRHTGKPIHNAIVWQCRRTAAMCNQLRAEGFDRVIQAKTGLVTDAYFSGTKVAWLLDHVPDARARAERGDLLFGTVDTFLLWKLTEGRSHATDVSNASRTLLYNIHTHDWDDEILARLNIPRGLLPTVQASSGLFGETRLLANTTIPICGMAGDQHAATFGQVCTQPGMAKNTYGTGCFMMLNTGSEPVESRNQLLTTVAWQLSGQPLQYALEGSVFIAGAAVQWLRDGLALVAHAAETEALARTLSSSDGVYFVPAFVGLGAPYWMPDVRGTIVGLTRGTTRAHLVRAALEAVAFQAHDVFAAMMSDSAMPLQTLRVDGGMSRNDFVLQFQADILNVPVERPKVTETTALGAAYFAGLAAGVWPTVSDLTSHWQLDRRYEPAMSSDEREALIDGWKRAIRQAQTA